MRIEPFFASTMQFRLNTIFKDNTIIRTASIDDTAVIEGDIVAKKNPVRVANRHVAANDGATTNASKKITIELLAQKKAKATGHWHYQHC